MKKTLFGLATAVLLAVPVASANAALNAYLKITGSHTKSFAPDAQTGIFQALCTNESLAAKLGGAESIKSPRDSASGQATGRRTYEPIRFTKRIDKSSPMLAKAFETKEVLPSVTMFLFRDMGGGMVEVFAEVTLSDCMIHAYGKATPKLMEKAVNGRVQSSSGDADDRPTEEVAFSYSKIEWNYYKQASKMKNDAFKWDLKKNTKI